MLLRDKIEKFYEQDINSLDKKEALQAFNELKFFLNYGEIRVASPTQHTWAIHPWVKKGLILGYRLGEFIEISPNEHFRYFEKNTYLLKKLTLDHRIRVVPGGTSIADGSFIGINVTIHPPSSISIGTFIDEQTTIQGHVSIGPCTQIGKRVFIGAGTIIGGELTPIDALPAIIEDDVYIGSKCCIEEGIIVQKSALLAPGTLLTPSTPVFDVVHNKVYRRTKAEPLVIPQGAVVVPGTRALNNDFARSHGIGMYTPIIIQYRDETMTPETVLDTTVQ